MADTKIDNLQEIDLNSGIHQYVCRCPNCASLGKRIDDYKLSISIDKNVFHCYRCGWSGKVSSLLKGYVSRTALFKYTSEKLLNTKKYLNNSNNENNLIRSELIDYDNISIPIDNCFFNAKNYLKKRNIFEKNIEYYNIRIGKGLYQGRILIPTFDLNGNVVYLVARDYINPKPESKYINPPGSHKSLAVWNIQNVKKDNKVIITEGCFSGIAADRNTDENTTAVSVFGKVISDIQAEMINKTNPSEVCLCFDGDVSKAEIINNYKILCKYYKGFVSVIKLQNEEDPDNMGDDSFKNRFNKRLSIKNFEFSI